MLEKILMFQYGGFYGGEVGNLLAQWEHAGFFSYVLPFLLIFALVFGILTKVRVFDDKAINGIIAFVVGALSLQFHFVPLFFSQIFPRVGVGLAVILALIILVGLFFDRTNKFVGYSLLTIGFVVFVVVLVQTFGWVGGYSSFWFHYNWPKILGVVIFLVIIGIIVGSGRQPRPLPNYNPIIFGSPQQPGK